MSAVQDNIVSSTPGDALPGGEEFTVEKILDRRFDDIRGLYFYLIKWQGYSDQDNTWEPEENLAQCPDILVDFEKRMEEHERLKEVDPIAAAEEDIPIPMKLASPTSASEGGDGGDGGGTIGPIGFARGFEAQKILGKGEEHFISSGGDTGATDCGGELCFLVKWKGTNVSDIVPAREANVKCPQEVIKFYEGKIKWNDKRTFEQMVGLEEEPDPEEDDWEDDDEVEGYMPPTPPVENGEEAIPLDNSS